MDKISKREDQIEERRKRKEQRDQRRDDRQQQAGPSQAPPNQERKRKREEKNGQQAGPSQPPPNLRGIPATGSPRSGSSARSSQDSGSSIEDPNIEEWPSGLFRSEEEEQGIERVYQIGEQRLQRGQPLILPPSDLQRAKMENWNRIQANRRELKQIEEAMTEPIDQLEQLEQLGILPQHIQQVDQLNREISDTADLSQRIQVLLEQSPETIQLQQQIIQLQQQLIQQNQQLTPRILQAIEQNQ